MQLIRLLTKPNNQSINPIIDELFIQSPIRPVKHWIIPPTLPQINSKVMLSKVSRSFNQSFRKPTNQSFSQPITHSISQLINQPTNQSLNLPVILLPAQQNNQPVNNTIN